MILIKIATYIVILFIYPYDILLRQTDRHTLRRILIFVYFVLYVFFVLNDFYIYIHVYIATAKTVTTVSYGDSACTAETATATTTQTFSEYGMGTCNSDGTKKICRTRGTVKFPHIRSLLEIATNTIAYFL